MPKRWILVAVVTAFCVCFTPVPAHAAYIDPATTSFLIQILSGVLITLSVAISVFFRKIQLFFITLSARLSSFWVRVFTTSGRQAWKDQKAREAKEKVEHPSGRGERADHDLSVSKWAFLWGDRRVWWVRLGLGAMVALSMSMVLLLFPVLDLYANNSSTLPFSVNELFPRTMILFVSMTIIVMVVLFLLRGRVFDLALSGVMGVALAGWLQMNFMNPDFGTFMGDAILWHKYKTATLTNILAWIAILVGVILIRVIHKKLWTFLICGLAMFLTLGNVFSLVNSYSKPLPSAPSQKEAYLSYENAFSLSSTHNEIVFLIDRFDLGLIDQIRESTPDFFDPLTGFVEFQQNMSSYSNTHPAVVSMLTGQHYLHEIPWKEYKTNAWNSAEDLRNLKDAGYSINIFTEAVSLYTSPSDVEGLVDNLTASTAVLQENVMMTGMVKLAAFVTLPVVAKPSFWIYSTEFADVYEKSGDDPYVIDDAAFYSRLKEQDLSIRGTQPQFNFIHFHGSHAPYVIDAKAQPSSKGTDQVTQTKGVFHIIFDYLDRMKKLGIYEDSTIIITGDHGNPLSNDTRQLTYPKLTGLFAKPRGAADIPPTVSLAPTSDVNFLPTLVTQAHVDPADHTLLSYFNPNLNPLEPRYYNEYRPKWTEEPAVIIRCEVIGDARKWTNWRIFETIKAAHKH